MSTEFVDKSQRTFDFLVTTNKRKNERVSVQARSYELASLAIVGKVINEQRECIETIIACENYADQPLV